MSRLEIVVARPGEYLDDAARIWAQATAARDEDPKVPPIDAARPLIESVVNGSPDSLLLIALASPGRSIGFAACAPAGSGAERRAELRYLGVVPGDWGGGVATQLLAVLPDQLRARGFVEAELWVYPDNRRAVDLYRRAAWQPSPEVRVNPSSGRPMRRFVLPLAARPPRSD